MKRSLPRNRLACLISSTAFLASVLASGCGSDTAKSAAANGPSCQASSGSHFVDHARAGFLEANTAEHYAAGQLARLHGHVPPGLDRGTDDGKLESSTELAVTVSLKLNNEEELLGELADLYNPASPRYRNFLTPDEFRAKYAPTPDQADRVAGYLAAQGLHSISVDPNGYMIRAKGSPNQLGATFHTELHRYQDARGNAVFAPHYELQAPAELGILAVHGLQSLSRAHAHAHKAGAQPHAAALSGTGPNGGYSPADIRQAYRVPEDLDGSGQTLAVFELDGYAGSDITAYEKQFGFPAVPLENVYVDGANGSIGSGQGEVTLDIELMIALAPKASKILVYEGPNNEQGILDTYAKIANENRAQAISSSWGLSEDGMTAAAAKAENSIFMQMAAQGQTIFVAAGDAGAYDNGSTLSVDDPGGQPYVVAVGGTTLYTKPGGAYDHETTWNDGSGAGGGGVSIYWTIPDWQKGSITAPTLGSTKMRNVPDVALHADINSGYAIFAAGTWGNWGGTSCAAPLWAAFGALVNQRRAQNGRGPVGYLNPALYSIGSSNHYSSDFFDIADGSTNRYYPAVKGYDDATGWGSFDASALIPDLALEPESNFSSSVVGSAEPPLSCR